MESIRAILVRLALFVAAMSLAPVSPALVGCGSESEAEPGCSTESAACDESSGTSRDESWLPEACSLDRSPFLQPQCLDALRLACNEHSAENVCTASPVLPFASGGYEIRCAWAKVVTFSDADSCTVESVDGRCEASIEGLLPCGGDPCTEDSLMSSVSAVPSESEIIQLCGGPLGSWNAVGSTESYASVCEDGIEPPPPSLCDCTEAACQAS